MPACQSGILLSCLTAVLLLGACHDAGQSPPAQPEPPAEEGAGGSTLEPVDLVYVCGNKFLATNATRRAVEVEYREVGTGVTGRLVLEPGPDSDPGHSETELETTAPTAVELYVDEVRVARRSNEGAPCGPPSAALASAVAGPEETMGEWTDPFPWPIIAVHLNLLPDGKVLSWGEVGQPQVWDPATGLFSEVALATELFCSGHTFLPDGRLLVTGGHYSDDHGLPDVNLFQPSDSTWSPAQAMAKGRWYPSATTLANGEVVTLAGRDLTRTVVLIPEVWTGSGWRALTSASRNLPYYPRALLAPNGRVFIAGERRTTLYLSTSGTGSWKKVADRLYGTRDYGAALMYEPGKVLYAGGGRTTNTAEIIDLNQASPRWQWTGSMAYARRHLNATILPTGQVLVTGGTGGTTHTDESKAVFAAELWDPTTGLWSTLASGSIIRGYHSTAILLPDARVLVAGSGDSDRATDQHTAELYSPPYLFKGARPVISNSPATMSYGQTHLVGAAEPGVVGQVSLVRLGSSTHAMDFNQRFNRLGFVAEAEGIRVTAPANRRLAPPGHYLLFLVSRDSVPSEGRMVQLR